MTPREDIKVPQTLEEFCAKRYFPDKITLGSYNKVIGYCPSNEASWLDVSNQFHTTKKIKESNRYHLVGISADGKLRAGNATQDPKPFLQYQRPTEVPLVRRAGLWCSYSDVQCRYQTNEWELKYSRGSEGIGVYNPPNPLLTSCIYMLDFGQNKRYIGKSDDINHRLDTHKRAQTLVGHEWRRRISKQSLSVAFLRDEDAPVIYILAQWLHVDNAAELEPLLIHHYNTMYPNGFNMTMPPMLKRYHEQGWGLRSPSSIYDNAEVIND